MKKLILLIIVLIMSGIAYAPDIIGDKSDQLIKDTLVTDLTGKKSNEVFTELILNKEAESVFQVANPSETDIPLKYFGLILNEVCGHVKSYQVLMYQECTVIETQCEGTETHEECTYYPEDYKWPAHTDCYNVTNKVNCKDVEVNKMDYCYTDKFPTRTSDIKIVPVIEDEMCDDGFYGHKIDWIPSLDVGNVSIQRPEWAWWNSSGLDRYYSFDTSGPGLNVPDSTNHTNGTNHSAAWSSTGGVVGGAYSFLPKTQTKHINSSTIGAMNTNTSFSINFWANVSNRGETYFALSQGVGDGLALCLAENSAGSLFLTVQTKDLAFVSGGQIVNATNNLTNVWQMHTIVVDVPNRMVWYYINGTNTKNFTGATDASNAATTALLTIGDDNRGVSSIGGFEDEWGIWNRTLSASEVLTLYQNPGWANGSSGSSSSLTLSIITPTNTTYNYMPNLTFNYSNTTTMDKCWYYNGTGNTSPATCNNFTGITWQQGATDLILYANMTDGTLSSTNQTFTVDTLAPAISIVSPSNNTNTSNTGLDVTYTAVDINRDSCWYNNNSGTNATLAGCANLTTITWSQGTTTVNIYVNDTAGNMNSTSVTFTVDSIAPALTLIAPSNTSYTYNSQINLTYTTVDSHLDSCWYKNETGSNATLSGCANLTGLVYAIGGHAITLYVNDTFGNVNSTSVTFTINTTSLSVTLITPTNTTYNYMPNLTFSYANTTTMDKCWYYNGTANTSPATCNNFTGITWQQGATDLILYANDTSGNNASANVTFFVDTIFPLLTIMNPASNGSNYSTMISVNFSVNDTNINSVNWSNNSGLVNNTIYTYCYQESANISTLCGGLNTGVYGNKPNYLYVNYTKPATATSALWQVKHSDNNTYNVSILGSCFSQSILQLRFFSGTNELAGSYGQCYNGSWQNITSISPNTTSGGGTLGGGSFNSLVDESYSTYSCYTGGIWDRCAGLYIYANIYEEAVYWYMPIKTSGNYSFNSTWIQGNNNITIFVNDIAGNINYSSVSFNIDSLAPALSLIAPSNTSYPYNSQINLTYTAVDSGNHRDSCWYKNETGSNATIAGCNNITGLVYGIGGHTISLYSNDTFGNVNSTSVTFTINTTTLLVSISSPTNSTYNSMPDLTFNYTNTTPLDKCWYFNGTGNTSPAACNNFTGITWQQGTTDLILYINDTSGNNALASVTFTVDTVAPALTLIAPANTSYAYNSQINLTYTAVDTHRDSCWYKNETGSNATIAGCNNLTSLVYAIGGHAITLYSNDTYGNLNTTSVSFTINPTSLNVSLITPINTTYSYMPNLTFSYVNTTPTDKCWYYNGTANTTPQTCANYTGLTWQQGATDLILYINDTSGRMNTTSVTFTVDTVAPALTLIAPMNTSYAYNTQINLTYTTVDSHLDSCWYKNETGSNATLSGCANLTGLVYGIGGHTITIYSNDTFGNINSTSVNFTVNSTTLTLSIITPTNSSYNYMPNLTYSYSNTTPLDKCWYYNGTANTSPATCNNFTGITWQQGATDLILYANDTSGNNASASVTFTVDTVAPALTLIAPMNTSYAYNTQINLTYTTVDSHLDSCWYKNETGSNATLSGCANLTGLVYGIGGHAITLYVNDTFGNVNSTSVTFTINTTSLSVTLITPTNTTYNYMPNLTYSYANTTTMDKCWYYNGTANTSIAACNNFTGITWQQGATDLILYANDSAGTTASASVTFTVDTYAPFLNVTYPLNTTYTTQVSLLQYTVSDARLDKCWYNNGSVTSSPSSCINFTLTSINGSNTWTVYANDTLGNLNSSSVTFYYNQTVAMTQLIDIYIDGVLVSSTNTSLCSDLWDTGISTTAGMDSLGSNALNGSISQLFLYNRNLSAAEILLLSNQYKGASNLLGESNQSLNLTSNVYLLTANISAPNSTSFWYKNLTGGWTHIVNVSNTYYCNDINCTMPSDYPIHYTNGKISTIGYTGLLDELMIYNYALSLSETKTLYNGYNASLQITILDENTSLPFSFINYDIYSATYSDTFTNTLNPSFVNGMPINETITLSYSWSGYDQRRYYFELSNISHNSVTLYLLPSSLSSDIVATVYDNTNTPLEGAYITVMRYFVANNSYSTVSQVTTDSNGQALLYLQKNTILYKFIIQYPLGTVVYSTQPADIIQDTIAFRVNTQQEAFKLVNDTLGIVSSGIQYDNTTGTYSVSYSNVKGSDSTVQLNLYKVDTNGQTLLNTSQVTSTSGSLSISTIPLNDTQYLAQAVVVYSPNRPYVFDILTEQTSSYLDLGAYGMFLVLVLTVLMLFTAYLSITLMIIVVPIPLLICSIMGIIIFPFPVAIGIEFAAIIVAFILRN